MVFWKRKEEKKEIRYILSIDGGGMRGIIPAYIISRLNSILLDEGDRRPLYSHFDLIAGTSTGALIALALSSYAEGSCIKREDREPYPVESVWREGFLRKRTWKMTRGYIEPLSDPASFMEMYTSYGSRIFSQKSGSMKTLLYPIFSDKYDVSSYEKFLAELFEETKLSDARVPTMAVAYSADDGDIYLMKSWDSHGILIKEAARASSAAPMYFPPAAVAERDTGHEKMLIDGGIAANNPVLAAYSEARKLYPDADIYRVLSISTCPPRYRFNSSEARGGLTSWASPIINLYGDASIHVSDMAAEAIKDMEYTRIWAPVLEKRIKLDDTGEESIAQLTAAAERTYLLEERKIREYAAMLTKESVHASVRLEHKLPGLSGIPCK